MKFFGFVFLFAFCCVFIDELLVVPNTNAAVSLSTLLFAVIYCIYRAIDSYKKAQKDNIVIFNLVKLLEKHGDRIRHLYIDNCYLYYFDKKNNRIPLVYYRSFMKGNDSNGSDSIAYNINQRMGCCFSIKEDYDEVYDKDSGEMIYCYRGCYMDLSERPTTTRDKRTTMYTNNCYMYTTFTVLLIVLFDFLIM